MYSPPLFLCSDPALTLEVVARYPFATWMATHDGVVEITHLPSLVLVKDGPWRVVAHVAKANLLASMAKAEARATVVFRGPDAYVSPTWYEHPDRQVPTWNYVAVHLSGTLRLQSVDDTMAGLRALTERLEGEDGWSPDKLERGQLDAMARGIEGIELVVSGVEHKRKLSQNRSPADRQRVLSRLANSADQASRAVAEAMTVDSLEAR